MINALKLSAPTQVLYFPHMHLQSGSTFGETYKPCNQFGIFCQENKLHCNYTLAVVPLSLALSKYALIKFDKNTYSAFNIIPNKPYNYYSL